MLSMNTVEKIRHKASSLGASSLCVIFGSSVASVDGDPNLESMLATAVEHILNENMAMVNGGYMGTMSATANAIKESGGIAIGVPCGNLDDQTPISSFSEIVYATNHWDRLESLIVSGDVFVVLPGGIGTATEIATLLWNADRNFLRHRPIMFIGGFWERWIIETVNHDLAFRNIDTSRSVYFAKNLADVSEFFFNISRKI